MCVDGGNSVLHDKSQDGLVCVPVIACACVNHDNDHINALFI